MTARTRTLQPETGRETKKFFAKRAKECFELLEENGEDPAIKRAARILELLTIAEHLRVEIYNRAFSPSARHDAGARAFQLANQGRVWPDGMPGDCHFSDPVTREMNDLYRQCLIKLNRRLMRYNWRFIVQDSWYRGLQRSTRPDNDYRYAGRAEQIETQLVYRFLILVSDKETSSGPSQLYNFRKCRDCSRWFYAVTDHQQFCQEACRKHHAAQSPEFKEKRRIYMRERYRPQQKELEKRSLQNARRTRKGAK